MISSEGQSLSATKKIYIFGSLMAIGEDRILLARKSRNGMLSDQV